MFAKILFGEQAQLENLQPGTLLEGYPVLLARVLGLPAAKEPWCQIPQHMEKVMDHITRESSIQTNAMKPLKGIVVTSGKDGEAYRSIQLCAQKCVCRVFFGGDKLHKHSADCDKYVGGKAIENIFTTEITRNAKDLSCRMYGRFAVVCRQSLAFRGQPMKTQ